MNREMKRQMWRRANKYLSRRGIEKLSFQEWQATPSARVEIARTEREHEAQLVEKALKARDREFARQERKGVAVR